MYWALLRSASSVSSSVRFVWIPPPGTPLTPDTPPTADTLRTADILLTWDSVMHHVSAHSMIEVKSIVICSCIKEMKHL
jgi:hypothetical protein